MAPKTPQFEKCYVAAPPGLDLGALPEVLAEKGISWEWAREHVDRLLSRAEAIHEADFLIAILVGTSNDYEVFYEVGLAVGMEKPIFLIARGRRVPLDWGRFPIAKVPLNDRRTLEFHLDIFFKTPKIEAWAPKQFRASDNYARINRQSSYRDAVAFNTELERRVSHIIQEAGGRVVFESDDELNRSYRPDLLAWLGHEEPELLDPTVIEVKARRVDPKEVRKIEEQLLLFIDAPGRGRPR